ncbi:hypothetical protein ARMSODRAFT_1009949, partial [Armillaria solidipes]
MARTSGFSNIYSGYCTCRKCLQHNPNGRRRHFKTAQKHAKQEQLEIANAARSATPPLDSSLNGSALPAINKSHLPSPSDYGNVEQRGNITHSSACASGTDLTHNEEILDDSDEDLAGDESEDVNMDVDMDKSDAEQFNQSDDSLSLSNQTTSPEEIDNDVAVVPRPGEIPQLFQDELGRCILDGPDNEYTEDNEDIQDREDLNDADTNMRDLFMDTFSFHDYNTNSEQDIDEGLAPTGPAFDDTASVDSDWEDGIDDFTKAWSSDVKTSCEFIECLKTASHDELDPEILAQVLLPEEARVPVTLSPNERLSIDIFLAVTNASEATYNAVKLALERRSGDIQILSYYKVKKLLQDISGVIPIVNDMCIKSCVGFTGPYKDLTDCPFCGEHRYTQVGGRIPRKQFHTIPIGPQLQALWRSPESAEEMQYRRKYTENVLDELAQSEGVRTSPFRDFFDGSDYLYAVLDGKIKPGDMVLIFSMDGAQLYCMKMSDCWMYIWIILDLSPDVRYQKKHVLLGGFIPGPDKPKNLDSFIFPGLHHLAAIQKDGLTIWNAKDDIVFQSNPFLALVTADSSAMAALSGCVGHHEGGAHYYPALNKPQRYTIEGCDHDDVSLDDLLNDFTSKNLYISLWRGTIDCDKTDNRASWPWAVLVGNVWKDHGKLVASATPHIPGSFDRPPRNIADKITSGYKAWEFLQYFFGLGPALLYGLLPEPYYGHYCKIVQSIRILLQEEIEPHQLSKANDLLLNATTEFEDIYVKRRSDRLHFIRQSPGIIYSQWPIECTFGNIEEEVKQHSNAFANMTQRGIRRCQVNALKAMMPELDPLAMRSKRGIDLGKGYTLLGPCDTTWRRLQPCEVDALRVYKESKGDTISDDWDPSIMKWARVQLPNNQIARSRWKEGKRPVSQVRSSRNIKIVDVKEHQNPTQFGEVLFFAVLPNVNGIDRPIALVSLYGKPDPVRLQASNGTYYTAKHRGDDGLVAVDIHTV